ncbi:Nuclear inhibitor of protein phosphatase 1 [Sciurus carolinensis]|uniref:Syntaxin-12 n=1 Tax=Sciurus carolinensis TaxID=30640 RepID=A0AA41N1P6_SCICA|nr:Nuclear inhibitor of protein phosphatase 1 [Sciurus carolinensis]
MSYGPLDMYRNPGPSGPQLRDFNSIIQTCSGNIQRISQATAQIKNLMSQLGTKQDSSKLQENLQQLQHSTNQLAKETNELLKELGSLPLPLSTSEQRQQKLQKERLMNDFSAALNNFQAVQRRVSEKEKESIARARAGSRLSAEERQREEQLVSFDSHEEWNQMQSQEDEAAITEQDLELIKERETAIRQLEADILDVNQIFKDLAMMIHDQGDLIDSIEANVESSEVHVERATDQLQRAAYYQKLIIDEKKYYLFGRNPDLCDFTIDHQSCSRVHAALVYHKHLKRVFLIDLNSTHGTFLGHIRLEPHKPQQIPIDSTVSFGASTRAYTLREKPQTLPSAVKGDEKMSGEDDELKGLLGLPEEETELDNLTEFNTAHNKRISTLTIEEGNLDIQRPKRKRKNSRVTFSEDDEIINPEDVDPSVGRFRNMVQTAVVPVKKKRVEGPGSLGLEESGSRRMQNFAFSGGLYGGLPPTHSEAGSQPHGIHGTALIGGLPMPYPNLAPDVDLTPVVPSAVNMNPTPNPAVYNPEAVNEPKKKKYAKEAWPGKKPTPSLLI